MLAIFCRMMPIEAWMAERSSGNGRSKLDFLPRLWRGAGLRVVWW